MRFPVEFLTGVTLVFIYYVLTFLFIFKYVLPDTLYETARIISLTDNFLLPLSRYKIGLHYGFIILRLDISGGGGIPTFVIQSAVGILSCYRVCGFGRYVMYVVTSREYNGVMNLYKALTIVFIKTKINHVKSEVLTTVL
jgi:hypothetical protein